jgi:hypothetical protein
MSRRLRDRVGVPTANRAEGCQDRPSSEGRSPSWIGRDLADPKRRPGVSKLSRRGRSQGGLSRGALRADLVWRSGLLRTRRSRITPKVRLRTMPSAPFADGSAGPTACPAHPMLIAEMRGTRQIRVLNSNQGNALTQRNRIGPRRCRIPHDAFGRTVRSGRTQNRAEPPAFNDAPPGLEFLPQKRQCRRQLSGPPRIGNTGRQELSDEGVTGPRIVVGPRSSGEGIVGAASLLP